MTAAELLTTEPSAVFVCSVTVAGIAFGEDSKSDPKNEYHLLFPLFASTNLLFYTSGFTGIWT